MCKFFLNPTNHLRQEFDGMLKEMIRITVCRTVYP